MEFVHGKRIPSENKPTKGPPTSPKILMAACRIAPRRDVTYAKKTHNIPKKTMRPASYFRACHRVIRIIAQLIYTCVLTCFVRMPFLIAE